VRHLADLAVAALRERENTWHMPQLLGSDLQT
jgi:hypothetical protein